MCAWLVYDLALRRCWPRRWQQSRGGVKIVAVRVVFLRVFMAPVVFAATANEPNSPSFLMFVY